jgi:6-phosphogluconolactonase
MIVPDPTGALILVPDLGLDRVLLYRLTPDNKLIANHPAWLEVAAGAGPRHLAFHPTLPRLYVINELDSTITVFEFALDYSAFSHLQTITTLPADIPDDIRQQTTCADIHITPDGRFLYGSNRGHDSLAIFSVDAQTGLLTPVSHQPTLGSFPRSFALDASGQWLVCANQNTHDIQVFRVNSETGFLTHAAEYRDVSMPICVRIVTP